ARVVALTFDDGPWDETTAEVLDLLRTHQLRATFFVVGREASTYPDALRAIVAAGHEVGNHTWTHRRLLGMSQATLASEVERTDAVIRDAQYPGPILFRPPHGKRLLDASYYLAHHDRLAIMWDVQPDSERGIADDPAAMTRHLMQHVKPGAIVLMHVLHPARTASRTALPAMIEALKHTGYRFVTVSELLALEPQHMAEATSVHLWNH
ncbi:MAG: polysaccharide deacetylase family protein, partial [Polyangiales bacterium]